MAAATTDRDNAARDAATVRAAWQAGVDPERFEFLQFKLAKDPAYTALDPNAADFGDKLAASVAAQVAADQSLRLTGSARGTGSTDDAGSADGALTREQFAKLSISERTNLYRTNRALYDQLAK